MTGWVIIQTIAVVFQVLVLGSFRSLLRYFLFIWKIDSAKAFQMYCGTALALELFLYVLTHIFFLNLLVNYSPLFTILVMSRRHVMSTIPYACYYIWKPCFVFNQNQFYIKAQGIIFFYFLDWWIRWKIGVFYAFWLSRCWEDWKFIVWWFFPLLLCTLFVFSVYNGPTTQKETNAEPKSLKKKELK